eukprot:775984-Prymnesium_polylepis.1
MPSRGPMTDWPDFGSSRVPPARPPLVDIRRQQQHGRLQHGSWVERPTLNKSTWRYAHALGSCVATDGCADGAATSVAT